MTPNDILKNHLKPFIDGVQSNYPGGHQGVEPIMEEVVDVMQKLLDHVKEELPRKLNLEDFIHEDLLNQAKGWNDSIDDYLAVIEKIKSKIKSSIK